MHRTVVVEGVSFKLVPATGREDRWLVYDGAEPIGMLRRIGGTYEIVQPIDAPKQARELMGRVREAVDREGTLDEITKP